MAPINTRVVVPDLAPPDQLRPVQHSVDTFAGAPRPVIDNDLQRLGEALMGFSSALAHFAATANRIDKQNDPRLADAYRIMSSANDPEFIKGLQQGTLPWQNVPHIRSLYEADAGQRAARSLLHDIEVGAKDGTLPLVDQNGNPTDFQKVISDRIPNYLAFPQSPHFMKSFNSTLEAGRNRLSQMQITTQADINRERVNTLVKSAIEDVVNYASQGRDDDFLRKELQRRTELAWKVTGTRPAQVDALMIGRIRELATQDPDAAERLLTMDRGKGFDGQPIGALAQNPTYRKDVEEILQKINEEREKRFDVAERNKLAEDARRRLEAGDGSFNAITNYSYINPFAARDPSKNPHRMISKETIQDEALSQALIRSNQEFRRQGQDPATAPGAAEAKFRREYEMFVNANRPHPEWQATIQTAGRVLSNPVSLSDPRNVNRVMQAYQLYNTLYARNPAYVTETLGVGERERKFYEQLRVYHQTLGDPPQEAARKAAEFVTNPPPPLSAEETDKLKQAIKNVDLNGWKLGGSVGSWFGEAIQNAPQLRDEVFQAAKAIAADRKIPMEDAIKAAAERVQDRTLLFNGQAVAPNVYLTKESAPFFQKRLDELFNENKQVLQNSYGIGSSSDLSLREEGRGTGVFRVIGKDGQTIVIPQQREDGSWDYSPLRVFSRDIDTIRAEARKRLLDNVQQKQRRAADEAIVNQLNAIDLREKTAAGVSGKMSDAAKQKFQQERDALGPDAPIIRERMQLEDEIARRQKAIEGSGLGGEWRKAQQRKIDQLRERLRSLTEQQNPRIGTTD